MRAHIKKVGMVVNHLKPSAPDMLLRLSKRAKTLGLQIVCCDPNTPDLPNMKRCDPEDFAGAVDVVIALGGDGTMLHAVRLLGGRDLPLIGVNIGSLGFMTSVADVDLERAMDALAAGEFTLSVRTTAEAEFFRGGVSHGVYRAVNDVVIGWGETSRVLSLSLAINGEPVGTYVCDGLICSTPTGSTGHSLSAGGPILLPESPVFVINPICPHTLSNRPMVVPDLSEIDITVGPTEKHPLLVVDGQDHHQLRHDDRIAIRRSPTAFRLIHLTGYSYFSLLSRKLHWRASNL
ncbi:MAG: NAD(+)/NADH kinase [Kiritimatiellae bacterium]|nr:NAD(+)/NADH kinase [Kiritimatiellia bacterium]